MLDKGFDYRWKMFDKPQATVLTAWTKKTGLLPQELAGKTVLDFGCGCGRNSKLLSAYGAIVTGVDISPHAIQAARANCPNGRFFEADILSFETSETFDFVLSHGVLHHTGDTRRAFYQAAKLVSNGGRLSVFVYEKPVEDELMPHMHFLHDITRACPPEVLYDACRRWCVEIRDINQGNFDTLRKVLRVSNSLDDEECISDTFDWHCPQYRDWYGEDEIMEWFGEEGFSVIWTGFPVSVMGIKK